MSYASSLNVSDFDRKMYIILKEIKNQEIIIKEYIIIKIINFMNSKFDIYITILNNQARKKKKLSDLNDLL
jgi:hypothetical protein